MCSNCQTEGAMPDMEIAYKTEASSQVTSKESSELVNALREHSELIKMTHEYFNILESKLKPLRSPSPEKDGSGESRPWDPIHDTTAGTLIRDNDGTLRYLIDRIITLTQETRI